MPGCPASPANTSDTFFKNFQTAFWSKGLEAKDLFIEEYGSDPVTTAQDKLVVNVFVPVK